MTPQEQEAALATQIKKFDRLNIGIVIFCFIWWIGALMCSAYYGSVWYKENGELADVTAVLLTVIAALAYLIILALIFLKLMGMALRRYVPRYIIDESDPAVIKLIGEVRLTEYGRAKQVLLSKRKGYLLAKNVYEQYGCTMAAVPATDEELKAQKELEKFGIVI
ncbi:hypothetical protein [Aeromonas caviae]|jgi:hypothetical protein|uniref:hypothetical protein n=1 Tax=Aeromonas caviae TaxID=648 RepID=UPI00385EDCC0